MMPKLIDYFCKDCGKEVPDKMFRDTEVPPKFLEEKCPECGGILEKGLNFKNNCQVWSYNDKGGI
jgi:DNA-directed RNA polymerase subunit RPC12/RpoP